MGKLKKVFLIFSLTIIISAIGYIFEIGNIETNININDKELYAYNYNPSNMLDNVFEQGGMTILPFIYTNTNQTISESSVRNDFSKAGLTIQSISTKNIVTGTTIKTAYKTYTVLIYGDATGDRNC